MGSDMPALEKSKPVYGVEMLGPVAAPDDWTLFLNMHNASQTLDILSSDLSGNVRFTSAAWTC